MIRTPGYVGNKLVTGIHADICLDTKHLLPGSIESMGCRRQVIFYGFPEFWQIEEGDSRIHMVLQVILHIPIVECG